MRRGPHASPVEADAELGAATRVAGGPRGRRQRRSVARDLALILASASAAYCVFRSLGAAPCPKGEAVVVSPAPRGDAAAAPRGGGKALVKVFAFHKDEAFLLGDWLYYHASVFGAENVVVVDHQSSDPDVLGLLDAYARRGVSVVPFAGKFGEKAEALSTAMRAAAATADFLVPMDIDEFVVLEEAGGAAIAADGARIRAEFAKLPRDEPRKFKFSSRVAACPDAAAESSSPSAKRPALVTAFSPAKSTAMGKTFFRGGYGFLGTDQGNHFGKTRHDNDSSPDAMINNRNFDTFFVRTRLTLLHFSMPDFATWHAKLFQRAKAYGFTMKSPCEGIRRGQRYCRSFQKLDGGKAPLDVARAEYADVCDAIAKQQRVTGGPKQAVQASGDLGALARLLAANSPPPPPPR